MKVVALAGSPRRDGNSRLLAESVLAGARAAGHETELLHLPDHIGGLLRDCKECRRPDGACAIDDGYRALLLERVLPADALVYAKRRSGGTASPAT
jgi:multimeric flavodoxin WrbA